MLLILVSHGNYAKSALESAEMIAGKMDFIYTFGLFENMRKEEFKSQIEQCIDAYQSESILIISDLYGGTPSNVAIELMLEKDNITAIAGLSLGMLLSIMTSLDHAPAAILTKVRNEMSQYIVFPSDHLNLSHPSDDLLDL